MTFWIGPWNMMTTCYLRKCILSLQNSKNWKYELLKYELDLEWNWILICFWPPEWNTMPTTINGDYWVIFQMKMVNKIQPQWLTLID